MADSDTSWNTGDPLRSLPSTYCGRKAVQWWVDFLLWENLLNLHPEVERIVELGTGDGGFSLYLLQQAEQRGIEFFTFEKNPPTVNDLRAGNFPRDVAERLIPCDVFNGRHRVTSFLRCQVILHCDDGDKPRELATFAPHLQPGSLCVVHDWGVEVGEADVPNCLTPVHEELWRGVGLSAVFERKP